MPTLVLSTEDETMAKSFEQFITDTLGKQIEYHSYNPNAKFQCIDLVNLCIVEVLELDPVIGTNAKDFPSKINKEQFDVLENTPDFIPKKGDIPIWNGKVGGGAGHIAVVRDDKATVNTFNSLDQNWSKSLYVTLETHNYNNVTHFLRAKVQSSPETMPENTKIELSKEKFEELVTKSTKYDQLNSGELITKAQHDQEVKSSIKKYKETLYKVARQLDLSNTDGGSVILGKLKEEKEKATENKNFREEILTKLNVDKNQTDVNEKALGEIEKLLDYEDQLNRMVASSEKEKIQQEKKEALEFDELKISLQEIKEDFNKKVTTVETRINSLEESRKERKTESKNRFSKFLEDLKGIL